MKLLPAALLIAAAFPAQGQSIVNLERLPSGSQVFVDGVSVFPIPTQMHSGISIDVSSLPAGDVGSSVEKVRPTTELPAVVAGEAFGAFRIQCTFARQSFDDPIVLFGQPGAAHSHTFAGNTAITAFTTPASILGTGNSTCRGGTINKTGYWFPTMVDLKTNKAILPAQFLSYYKGGDFRPKGSADGWTDTSKTPPVFVPFQPPPNAAPGATSGKLLPLPPGLRMVAGDPAAIAPHPQEFSLRYKCLGGPKNQNALYGPTIPQCDVGANMTMEVFFPQCWDGVNLDSPNHKSHMSYTVVLFNKNDPRGWSHRECPATHPKILPQIAFEITYLVTEADQKWRLASDSYAPTLLPGLSGHGDWFNGWKVEFLQGIVENCINGGKDGHAHLLCDGREVF